MKKLLLITGVFEIATGLALILVPVLAGHLLLNADLAGVSIVVARVAGIALLALGMSCWPGPASLGMLTYNTLGAVYLGYVAVSGTWVGKLLWPAVLAHAVFAILLGRAWLMRPKTNGLSNGSGESSADSPFY
jgi:hypothetical protein